MESNMNTSWNFVNTDGSWLSNQKAKWNSCLTIIDFIKVYGGEKNF